MSFIECVANLSSENIDSDSGNDIVVAVVIYSGLSLRQEEAFGSFGITEKELAEMRKAIENNETYKLVRNNGNSLTIDSKSVTIEIDGNMIKIKCDPRDFDFDLYC